MILTIIVLVEMTPPFVTHASLSYVGLRPRLIY